MQFTIFIYPKIWSHLFLLLLEAKEFLLAQMWRTKKFIKQNYETTTFDSIKMIQCQNIAYCQSLLFRLDYLNEIAKSQSDARTLSAKYISSTVILI